LFYNLCLLYLRIEPVIYNLKKNPLRQIEITRIGGVDLALPIVGKTDPFQLRFKLGDVLARGDGRMLAALDRVLFGRQTERVPAHGMQDIKPAHSLVTRDDVGRGVTFRMPDMQTGAARIRKHIKHVEFRFTRIEIFLARARRVKNLALVPDRLPLGLDLIERIWFAAGTAHRIINQESRKKEKENGFAVCDAQSR